MRRPSPGPIVGVALAFMVIASMSWSGWGLAFNSSASMPTGLYLLSPVSQIVRNQLVAGCIPKSDLTDEYAARGYLPKSTDCPSGLARILKPVAAIGGDQVRIGEDGVMVNGRLISGSQVRDVDSAGRPLQHLRVGWERQIPKGSCFLLSNYSPRSLDSRYFGIVENGDLVYRARALLTL
jgi:conjugative transfer signal peptidase TraF